MKRRAKPKEPHPNQGFVDKWRLAGPALERIALQELRNYKHEEHRAIIDSLLEMAVDLAKPRTTSGLVELQRWLAKARR